MAIVAVSVAPAGIPETGMSRYVARAIEVARSEKRIRYSLGPMFTTLEGDLEVCLDVCRRMHEALFEMGAPRVSTVIKIDDRRDKPITMEGKTAAVLEKIREKD